MLSATLVLGVAGLIWFVQTRSEQPKSNNASLAPSRVPINLADNKSAAQYLQQAPALSREERVKQLLNYGNVPIEFWGRVVDQDGQSIPDAVIAYRVHRSGRQEPSGFVGDDSHKSQVASSGDGGFSITGDRGVTLSIEGIQKSGYRLAGKQQLDFGYHGTPDLFSPSPRQPQVFVLIHTAAMPSLVRYSQKYSLPWDGQAIRYDIQSGRPSPTGELRIVASRSQPDQMGRFDWSFAISVAEGGILEAHKGKALIAPDSGYATSWTCGYKAESKPWRFGLTSQLFVKTSKGEFGLLNLQIYADAKPAGKSLHVEGFINPDGGRLLEYDASLGAR